MTDGIDVLLANLDEYYPGSRTPRRAVDHTPARLSSRDEQLWDSRAYVKRINGVDRETFTMGALAQALGRPIVTVRLWTRKGYIPQAPYRLPTQILEDGRELKGRRLYTRSLIEATVEAFDRRGLIGSVRVEWSKHRDLSMELLETWTKIHAQENGR